MNKVIKDIIEWDIINWYRAIDFWERHIDFDKKKLHCLELGGRRGGLSLWLALKGNQVICSEIQYPERTAKPLHNKYPVKGYIDYEEIDATNIEYKNHFDIIVFKSILGGISRNNNDHLKYQTIDEIYDALKPGGYLLFAENLYSSKLHHFFRKTFTKWGSSWNYLKYDELDFLFRKYCEKEYYFTGFLGAFGRTESMRFVFGKIDKMLNIILPHRWKYIVIGIAQK